MGEKGEAYRVLLGSVTDTVLLEDLDVEGIVTLKYISH
jgi:hypothetical protein